MKRNSAMEEKIPTVFAIPIMSEEEAQLHWAEMQHGRAKRASRPLVQQSGRGSLAPDSEGEQAAMLLAVTLWASILGPPRRSQELGSDNDVRRCRRTVEGRARPEVRSEPHPVLSRRFAGG